MKAICGIAVASLALFALVTVVCAADFKRLRLYFNGRLDRDHDGVVTPHEWLEFLFRMDPDDAYKFGVNQTLYSFGQHDVDGDGVISWEEFSKKHAVLSDILGTQDPVQIHISLTANPSEMNVMWVTDDSSLSHPTVMYGTSESQLSEKVAATSHTYDVGHLGFHGLIYEAVMTNLAPSTQYYYKVGDAAVNVWSSVRAFKSSPAKGSKPKRISMATFGDQGTIAPFGFEISHRLTEANQQDPFDLMLLVGDIAYAGVSGDEEGEVEPIWDLYGKQIEPYAAVVPFLAGIGNHEHYYNYTGYLNRYRLPQSPGANGNFWWSVTYGSLHITHMSTEHPYTPGSPQYQFIEQDLAAASADPTIQWIVFGGHRPMYSSDSDELDSHQPGCALLVNLENLLIKYRVDIVMTGHMHCYERTYPVINGEPQQTGGSVFKNPKAPIYIVQGTAGAFIMEKWVTPQPAWSAARANLYGYGRMNLYDNGTLHYEFWEKDTRQVHDEFFIVKDL